VSENLFFDVNKLKYLGKNVIIGRTVRIRYPDLVELHDNTVIDDFTFISTGLILHEHSAIEAGSVIMGGKNNLVTVGAYSCICSNSTVMCGTHDFQTGLHLVHHNHVPQGLKWADVTIGEHVILGTKSTILPGAEIGHGARIGAHSLVNRDLDPWTLYGGTPVKELGKVDRDQVLKYLEEFQTNY
jgi:acetyltransferase-like isoleucine patch superfamily enzyme